MQILFQTLFALYKAELDNKKGYNTVGESSQQPCILDAFWFTFNSFFPSQICQMNCGITTLRNITYSPGDDIAVTFLYKFSAAT